MFAPCDLAPQREVCSRLPLSPTVCLLFFFFQAEDGIRDLVRSRGLGDVYKRQGIDSLKVRYNQVFGYYIEITKANLARVPADFILSLIHI